MMGSTCWDPDDPDDLPDVPSIPAAPATPQWASGFLPASSANRVLSLTDLESYWPPGALLSQPGGRRISRPAPVQRSNRAVVDAVPVGLRLDFDGSVVASGW